METKKRMMQNAFTHLRGIVIIIMAICLLVSIGINWLITHNISQAILLGIVTIAISILIVISILGPIYLFLKKYKTMIEQVSNGDLSVTKELDELQTNKLFTGVTNSIVHVVKELSDLIHDVLKMIQAITEGTDKVNIHSDQAIEGIKQITYMMQEIAEGVAQQAEQTQAGEELMEELAGEIAIAYSKCQSIIKETDKMVTLNKEGEESINALRNKVVGNKVATEEISEQINLLVGKMKNIALFVDTIENIASQTNLLALNAAIEAARAGDAGRGFGVVAEEIRKLADQSQTSTNEIKMLVDGIEGDVASVSEAMNKMGDIAVDGEVAVDATIAIFNEIAESRDKITKNIHETNSSISEVNQDKEKMTKLMQRITAVIQETAAYAQESSSSSQEQVSLMQQVKEEINTLSEMVVGLNTQLEKYK